MRLIYKSLITLTLALSFVGCFEERDLSHSQFTLGEKQVLREWPDSAYIAAMDSMMKEEVVVGRAQKADVEVSLGSTPTSLQALAQKAVQDGQKLNQKKKASQKDTSDSLESFLERFSAKIDAVRAGAINGKVVDVKAGQDINSILKAKYGALGAEIPQVLVKYQLQGINPALDLTMLKAGDQVRLPF